MELRNYAETILFGTTIDNKLAGPSAAGAFTDDQPGEALAGPPEVPGRPAQLAFDRRQDHAAQFESARRPAKLNEPIGRGLVLHYFANHELLALEVMALALLRFPDAPKSFRAGIARTMLEEQEHLRLYIARMKHLGVAFGDLPVNSFFWRTMKDISSPAEYSAAMSLTFEQANLDFALHYERIFREVGDPETADLMRRIHDDEVRHVEHGVKWLGRFEVGKDLWSSYLDHLQFPLTPSRAKGPVFDEEGRKRAGLNEDFISELKVFSSSKGRPADLWLFNPGCEREIATCSKSPFLSGPASHVESDLASLLVFLATPDDIVLTSVRPGRHFLASLKNAGFALPEIMSIDQAKPATQLKNALGQRKLGAFKPWGQTPAALAWAHTVEEQFTRMPTGLPSAHPEIFSKKFFAEDAGCTVCNDAIDLANAAAKLAQRGTRQMAVKPVLGASGFGLRKLNCNAPFPTAMAFPCVAGPWLEKICDLGALIEIDVDRRVRVLEVMRPLIDAAGRYAGHALGRPFSFPSNTGDGAPLSQEFFAGIYPFWMDQVREAASRCGRKLAEKGYSGPASIDAMIHREQATGELALHPVIEVNPRYSMGRIALALERHLARGQPAIWLHINKALMTKSGYGDFAGLAAEMTRRFPLQLAGEKAPLVKSGFLATNDPQTAQGIMTALFAGHDASEFAWQLLYAV